MKRFLQSIKNFLKSIKAKLKSANFKSSFGPIKNKSKKIKFKELFSKAKDKSSGLGVILGSGLKKIQAKTNKGKSTEYGWNEFVDSLFSVHSRGKVHQSFKFALVCSICFSVGKGIGVFLNKTDYKSVGVQNNLGNNFKRQNITGEIQKINNVDIFNTKEKVDAPKVKKNENIICKNSQTSSSLPIKLLSTVVLQDSVKSVAAVQIRGAELLNVREGERVDTFAEIGKIERLNIVVKNLQSGDCEYIQSEEAKKEQAKLNVVSPSQGQDLIERSRQGEIISDGKTTKIKKSLRDEMLQDISKILTQARAVQINNPDGSYCFKMTEVEPGSVYSLLDIQDNDIVCEINNSKITSLNELMNMFGQITEIEKFQLGLTRSGEKQDKKFEFID